MPNPTATKFYIRHKEGYPETEIFDYARRGFWLMGVETVAYDQIANIDTLEDLGTMVGVAGYIGDVFRALRKLGLSTPAPIDYMEPLVPFLGRRVWLSTLGKALKEFEGFFIKPVEQKAFTGFVWDGSHSASRHIIGHAEDTAVWVSDLVNIVSEYRSFILHGEILDCRRYKGDWSIAPSKSVIEAGVAACLPVSPIAFCLDWGVTAEGKTILVEANDGFAFGHYGLHPGYVAHMLSARWFELCGG